MKNICILFFWVFGLLNNINPLYAQWTRTNFTHFPNALAVSGTNLFAGTSSGVYLSTDIGTSWVAVNAGLTNTNIVSLVASGTNLFAGTSSGVYLSTNNGTSWTMVNNGLTSTSVNALTASGTNIFAATDSSGVFLSTNNGTNWTAANTILMRAFVNALIVSGTNLFVVAHSRWVSSGGIYLSTDNGASWTAVNTGLTNTSVSSFAAVGTNLFAATPNGVFLSTNNGSSWTAVNNGLTNTSIKVLTASDTNLFAVTPSGIFLSSNNGTNWIPVDNGLTNTSVNVLTVSATNLFEGFNAGISYTDLNWFSPVRSVTQTSPTNASIDQSLSPTFLWNADSNASTYHLQVSTDSAFTSIVFDDSVFTKTFQYPTVLLSNTTYYWRVSASNFVGTSPWTSIWHFTTDIIPPSNLSALAGNHRITLSWLASSSPNINKYKIYRGISSPASTMHDSTTTISYVDTGLTNGTQYFYRVTTESNLYIEGSFSTGVSATPFNMTPHAASLQNIYEPNAGNVPLTSLNFSSVGSYDSDGTVDSIFWFVDDNLVSKQQQLSYNFAQGTNQVKLVVEDNQGARDSSSAIVNISMFKAFLNGPVYAGPSLLGSGVLYVIGTGDAIYRMDSTGNVLYSLSVNGDVTSSSSISYDTTVYIASSDKNLYAFSNHGNQVWPTLALGGVPSSTPTIDSITNRLYVGVSNKNFIAVNRLTGAVSWNYFADAPIASSAVITSDRKLVVATVKGTIYGFDLTNPTIPLTPAWQLTLSDSVYSSPAIDNSGCIYYCATSGKVYKISFPRAEQSSIVWQAQTGGRIIGSPVIDGNGILYVGCGDSKLYAINTQNGNIKWTYQSGSPILSTPALSDRGMIYFGNQGGKVIALDSSSSMHWYYQDSTSIEAPLLYERETLYVGTVGARLLAFYYGTDSSILESNLKKAALATTNVLLQAPSWGTFQGNNQRTGVSNVMVITGIKNKENQLPVEYGLSQNYPNPFNPSTDISYQVASIGRVSLKIYDLLGREIATLVDEVKAPGNYTATFNAVKKPSGIYFYRLQANLFTETKKLILLK